jgi:hypothetical protein
MASGTMAASSSTRTGRSEKVMMFTYHPERHYKPISPFYAQLMGHQTNVTVALSGLPISVNTAYIEWFSSRFKENGSALYATVNALRDENLTGKVNI